ncbi:microtubule-associated protein futsch isoform X2 [Drosophila bipectinata]|uniref:microtubule-associated protein futsch isoform X2 n=1 Tax=Drosophila bipectinata TaxID=42026 RepID=UPI0038B3F382
MDKPERPSLMGPPPAVAKSANPSNNSAAPNPAASPTGDKSAPPPKRIIKQINLDFKKLKEAGLDRQLAEVLRKQSPGAKQAKPGTPPTPTVAGSASPSTSAAAQQKQQLRQTAPQPIKKRGVVSDYIEKIVPGQTNVDSSMHVKALLKNRILNKNTGGIPAKHSASRPPPTAALGSPDPSPTPGVFSAPIAKADVTVRPKQPPLLLNLVNKLPKCRSLCTPSSYGSKARSTPKEHNDAPTPEISNKPLIQKSPSPAPSAPSTPVVPERNSKEHNKMTPGPLETPNPLPQTPTVLPQTCKSSLPPLIVLENKVLSPDEKIDLSSLAIQQGKTLEKTDVIPPPAQSGKGKVILSTQKLKLSREKLSEMANEIRNQVKKVETSTEMETVPTTNMKTSNVEPLTINKESSSEVYNSTIETPTIKSGDVTLFQSPVKPSSDSMEVTTDTLSIIEPAAVPVYNPCTPEPEEVHEPEPPQDVKVDKSPEKSSTSKVLSAVDFIAQLAADNSMDDSSFMELSPEEQRLNALFGGGGGGFGLSSATTISEPEKPEEILKELPIPDPSVFVESPACSSKVLPEPDEELAIGKILKMDDVNILHATLDVNSDSANILRISPNAIKLQKSVQNLEKTAEEPTIVEPVEVPRGNQNLAANILAEQPKNANESEVPLEKKDPEPEKEANPPVKKLPTRSKRAKINLVQRTKRPSAAKASEAKRPKPEFEENDEPSAEAERNGEMEIEVSSDEGQCKEGYDGGAQPEKELLQAEEQEVKEETKPATDRDLTQLYHPPKMPKNKSRKPTQNQEFDESQTSTTASNVSLIDILSQEPPPPQGEAQLPFRKHPEEVDNMACSTPEVKGIQNLISHLEAEKVTTQPKKTSPSSEETPKAGSRKKLVKTRPVLGKRSAKEKPTSSIDPVPVSVDVRSRVPTSSTSDDDRSEIVGLEEKRTRTPVLSLQKKVNETDISDDASPDHDETEDEQLSHVKILQAKPEDEKGTPQVGVQNQEATDSDSSSPMDFAESVDINEDVSLNEHPAEESKDLPLNPGGGDTFNVVEANLEDSFRNLKEATTVISEKVSPIPENGTRRSRRRSTKKASEEKELSKSESLLPATLIFYSVENDEAKEKPEEPAVETSRGKRKSRSSAKANKSQNIPEESKDSETPIAVSSASEETKIPEEPTPSVKSLRQRLSRSRTPNLANNTTGEVSSTADERKIPEEPITSLKSLRQRLTRSITPNLASTATGEITSAAEETQIPEEPTTSVKSLRQRLTRSRTPNLASTATGESPLAAEETKIPEEPTTSVKSLRQRLSRSRTPKMSNTSTGEVSQPTDSSVNKVTEGEKDTFNNIPKGKRKSRSSTSQKTAPKDLEKVEDTETIQTVTGDTKVCDEKSEEMPSRKPSRNRKSRSKTPKCVDATPPTESSIKSSENLEERTVEEAPKSTAETEIIIKPKTRNSKKAVPDKFVDSEEQENTSPKTEELEISTAEEAGDVSKDLSKEIVPEDFKLPEKSVRGSRKSRTKELQAVSLQSPVINQESAEESNVSSSPVLAKRQRRSRGVEPSPEPTLKRKARSDPDPDLETASTPKEEPIQTPKRGRKRKEPETPKAEDVQPLDTPKTPSRRGRKRAAEMDSVLAKKLKEDGVPVSSFNLRLLLIRKREHLETDEVLTTEGEGNGPLQCGLCLARSTSENWQDHLLEHYGVGWLVEDTPELITRASAIAMMKTFLQSNPDKKLECRLCSNKLGSALGMMLHLESCSKKCPTDGTFNVRLLLIRKREQLETDEELTDEGKGDGQLQCGLCLARSSTEDWQIHLLEHYGVGWLVEEPPESVTRPWVIRKMKDYLLINPDQRFACRMCNHQLGTAMGMMLHLENCGRQRVACEFCKKLYAYMSLPAHLRTCPRRPKIGEELKPELEEEVKEPVYSNAGRAKRKSTIKAETKLKKIGEDLTSENTTTETDHQKDFDGDTSDYDMAMDKESSEEYESEGADSNEDPIISEGESEPKSDKKSKKSKAKDGSRKRNARKRPAVQGDVSEKPPLFSRYLNLELRIEDRWKKFLQISYSKGSLFPQFNPSYSIIPSEEAQTLLPSKESKSIRYAYGNADTSGDWQQMGLFEGFIKDGEYIGYLGGAIKQLAWAPLPAQVKTQYLLCSLRTKLKSFSKHAKIGGTEGALLMLLKCSVPDHSPSEDLSTLHLDLHYGIRVPNGPVHNFVFMPSGGYDGSTNRLGLLAVSTSISDVHIYALPLNLSGDERSSSERNVIQLNPIFTLSLDLSNPVQDQCTRICWSQARGHNFLVTGYAKGNVAFWDIGDTEGLNCTKQENRIYFAPLNFFFIGERNIQYLDLHYDAHGPRWLAVGTNVRRFCIYDIKNWSQPQPLVEGSSISHLYVTSLFWSPICETIIVGSNELFVNRMTRNLALNPSGINYDYKTLDSTVCSTRAMHSNVQKNYLVLGTDNGDLVFLDVRELNFPPALNKSAFIVRAVSTLDLVHLKEATSDPKDIITPEIFLRDYALRINPVSPVLPKNRSKYLNEKRSPKNITSMPLIRYNSVHCNWNVPTHNLVAVGTEHGLLRILNFQRDMFLKRTSQ